MKTLSVGEFKTHFSEVLEDVRRGQPVGVAYGRKGELVAVLAPQPLSAQSRGEAGHLKGRHGSRPKQISKSRTKSYWAHEALLDTHAFLWALMAPEKLGQEARTAIESQQ